MADPESQDRGGSAQPPAAGERSGYDLPFPEAEPAREPQRSATEPRVPHHAPPPPPPVRKSRAGAFFFGALSGCLVLFGVLFLVIVVVALQGDSTELALAGDKVAIVPIEGEITDARDTLEEIHRYSRNSSIKAIVVRINSPGGEIAPSQEIYSAILRLRDKGGKPVVASLDSVAASGGYYIASACDKIVANHGTITGSIGVILQWFDAKELIQWAKLKPETITSGALKDAGSPYREMTEPERQYFQGIVSQLHSQFVRDVARGRKLPESDVAKIADGRVFTGEQALDLKLVDELGTIDDAVRAAGVLGGIEGEPERVWPRQDEGSLLDLLRSETAESFIQKVASRRVPQFLFRW